MVKSDRYIPRESRHFGEHPSSYSCSSLSSALLSTHPSSFPYIYLKRLFISAKQVALLEQKEDIALEFEPGVGEIAACEGVLQGVGTT